MTSSSGRGWARVERGEALSSAAFMLVSAREAACHRVAARGHRARSLTPAKVRLLGLALRLAAVAQPFEEVWHVDPSVTSGT